MAAKAAVIKKTTKLPKQIRIKEKNLPKAWVISIRMGLGHQRAVFPLSDIAQEGILNVGEKETSSPEEIKLWAKLTKSYEFLSRVKKIPIIGNFLFAMLDMFLNIPPLYPLRDLSKPGFQTNWIYRYIRKGLGKTLMEKVDSLALPMISSYPVPALIADYYGRSRNYCIVTDSEISRGWVPKNPRKNKIYYCAPCSRSLMRLREYGIQDDHIFLTGFPLPKSLLGTEKLEILKKDLGQRLHYLDPQNHFWPMHEVNVQHFLGKNNIIRNSHRLLTITFAVGGAGAQADIGLQIAKSLRTKIHGKELKLNFVAGTREEVAQYFAKGIAEIGIPENLVDIIYSKNPDEYFIKFTNAIHTTDILWTKPSELSFYAGLGIAIIMTEPIGPQEIYNKKWLLEIQAGIPQENPLYTDEWLFDLLNLGRLAECAWDGFLKARKFGTFKIEEIIRTGTMTRESSPLRR